MHDQDRRRNLLYPLRVGVDVEPGGEVLAARAQLPQAWCACAFGKCQNMRVCSMCWICCACMHALYA